MDLSYMKNLLTLFFLLCIFSLQNGYGQSVEYCGSEQIEELLLENLEYRTQVQKEEQHYRSYIQNPSRSISNDEVTIPIVFQIIHNNGPENLSDGQIDQVLAELNDAFANTNDYQTPDGVHSNIQFCLAIRDPDGEDFSGIIRTETMYTDMSLFGGFSFVQSRVIDPDQYINIQIVANACLGSNCNIAGYAGGDRVVVQADAVSLDVRNVSTLAHEIGHYLGLWHTFSGGCKNNDCLTDGDRVCDTPPDNQTFDHCIKAENSCNSDDDDASSNNPFRPVVLGGLGDQNDLNTNFMDYNFRTCRNSFTQGQADRMHFFLQERYPSLLSSKGCFPPCQAIVEAQFVLPDSIEVGQSITISNLSDNADSYQWIINGIPVSTEEDLTFSFTGLGNIEVQLEAYTNNENCDTDIEIKNIRVYCPVSACFEYTIRDQYLIVEDCSANAASSTLSIINDGDTLLTTSNTIDSAYVNNIDFVTVCVMAEDAHCEDTKCTIITILSDGSEVCGNEEDDDDDGLIDLFDPDCPCEDGAYQANCPLDCEIIPDSFSDIKMKMKWESLKLNIEFGITISNNIVADFIDRDETLILNGFSNGNTGNVENYIAFISGTNGEIIDTLRIFPEFSLFEMSVSPVIYHDKLSDNTLVYIYERNELICLNLNGDEIFRSSHAAIRFDNKPAVADFNHDGIPEVYCGHVIFNGLTGDPIYVGKDCSDLSNCSLSVPVAADVIGNDNVPEFITGKYVYQLNINNLTDSIGNTANVIMAPNNIEDGRCGVSDINGDGQLDIIVVEPNNSSDMVTGSLSIWDPRTNSVLAKVSNPPLEAFDFAGGMPFIGDVDGDCFPEIGVVYKRILRVYKYIEGVGLEILYDISTTDESGFTGVTMFDFNQDGRQELVYRDETSLRVFDGATGVTLDSFPLFSGTGDEYPIVADVDNDGQAEIIVSGSQTSQNEVRMYCFESASSPWAPARSVWNQYAYNPTQINDDLTIPRFQQNAAQPLQGTENCLRETCNTPYNNFMVQATMRTQEGCYVWPELQRDFTISADSRCIGDSTEICVYVSGADSTILSGGITINCYPPPWDEGNGASIQSIEEIIVTNDTTCIMIPSFIDVDSLLLVVNDEGGVYPPDFSNPTITECDYTNNEFVLDLSGIDLTVEILLYECSADSNCFNIIIRNIGGGVLTRDLFYWHCAPFIAISPGTQFSVESGEVRMLKDTLGNILNTSDTIRLCVPRLTPDDQFYQFPSMAFSINDGGFGPNIQYNEPPSDPLLWPNYRLIEECDYFNNYDSIDIYHHLPQIDLGPDITKCDTELFTLNAGSGFETYLWSDLSIDSIYSENAGGIHYVQATDQCGMIYRDTIEVFIDSNEDVDLGSDIALCYDEDTTLSVSTDFDEVLWLSDGIIICDTCFTLGIDIDTTYEVSVQARVGACISYDTIRIERIIPEMDSMTMAICDGDTIDFFGTPITASGRYEYLAPDCSQLDILNVSVNTADTTFLDDQICDSDSLLFDGVFLDESGVYSATLQSMLGCDSMIMLNLEVVVELMNSDTVTICENDSIQIFETWFIQDTFLQQTFISSSGCDSIQTFNIIIENLASASYDFMVCQGDSIFIYDQWFTQEGSFDFTLENEASCDSLINLNIFINEVSETFDTIIACTGDTVSIFEFVLTSDDDISETIMSGNGCDSTAFVHMNFVDIIETTEDIVLCPGDSIFIADQWVFDNEIFSFTNSSSLMCDSIHTVNISFIENPPLVATSFDCETLEIELSIEGNEIWSPLWEDGSTSQSVTFMGGGFETTLTLNAESLCEEQISILLPLIPVAGAVPVLSDTLLIDSEVLTIDLGLDSLEWSILWDNADVIDCNMCTRVNITPTETIELTVFLDHISGCSYVSTFNITVEAQVDDIFIPNVFSPNGDGNNDQWSAIATENIVLLECYIFDRWGNKVYQSINQPISWDGTMNGNTLEQGVYVYSLVYLDENGNRQVKMGDTTLMR